MCHCSAKRGKLDKDNNDLVLSNDEIIKSLDENISYKYLGMSVAKVSGGVGCKGGR